VKKRDWFIVGSVLLAALLSFLATRMFSQKGGESTVTIYLHGEVYAKVSAEDYQSVTIDQGDGKVNVVVIGEKGVYMESSTCKNQICVRHGVIDPNHADELLLDNWIVCLPNGVSVEVTGGEGGR
jgi:hypothetical protein